jgi:formamidase
MTCSISQIIFVSSAVKCKATYGHYGIGLFSIKVESGTMDWERIAAEAARTIPGRENGGNCDIKNLSRGCKVYFPVFVEGANLSMGDMHFSQGDGEVSFCGAIEMSGFLELRCEILRGGMEQYLTPMGPTKLHVNPIFEIGPLEPRFSEWLVFEGLSVDERGKQHYLDVSIAYKRAVLNCIDYLSKFGYTKEQVSLSLLLFFPMTSFVCLCCKRKCFKDFQ